MTPALRQFWQARTSRERLILSAGGGALALLLLYSLVWLPMSLERSRLRASLPDLRAKAAQMRSQAQEIGRLKASAGPDTQDIRAAIDAAAQSAGVKDKLTTTEALDQRRARVTFNEVAFDAYLNWLLQLQRQHRVRVESSQLEALPASGRVKVNVTLAKAGAST